MNRCVYCLSIPVSVGYDLVARDDTTFKFEVATDVSDFFSEADPFGSLSAAWNKGWKSFRLGLGLTVSNVLEGQSPQSFYRAGISLPIFVMMPNMQLWWFR